MISLNHLVTIDLVAGYVESESEDNQAIIIDFDNLVSSIGYMLYLIKENDLIDIINILNERFVKIQDNYKLIQQMDVYKEDARIQAYFDDLIPISYKYNILQIDDDQISNVDKHLELIEKDKFDTLFK